MKNNILYIRGESSYSLTLPFLFMAILILALPLSSCGENGKDSSLTVNKNINAESTDTTPLTTHMVLVTGGYFKMGDTFGDGKPDEYPVHEVCLSDFYIGDHEITNTEWESVMGSSPSGFTSCGNDCPVEQVSWEDAQDFINKYNTISGLTFRLPTEAEWEYAARERGSKLKWSGTSDSSKIHEYAWFKNNAESKTHLVKTKKPNALGLYDMTGNNYEWVHDWYGEDYYNNSPKNNPIGPETGTHRIIRGGSWHSAPQSLRASRRVKYLPNHRRNFIGFRLARTP